MAQRANLEEVSQPLHDAYACLLANGLDGAGEALRILVNEASRIGRAQHLQAMPYERSAQRVDRANGYNAKTMLTRLGEITFEVPQVRSADFLPQRLGARQPLRAIGESGAGRDVRAGRLNTQSHRGPAKAGRPRCQHLIDPDQPLHTKAR